MIQYINHIIIKCSVEFIVNSCKNSHTKLSIEGKNLAIFIAIIFPGDVLYTQTCTVSSIIERVRKIKK